MIDSKRDYVELITDREKAPEGSSTPDADNNINKTSGKDINTNGPGFLAPGTYTILDVAWEEPTVELVDTYYRISNITNSTPTVTVNNALLSHNTSEGRVETIDRNAEDWNSNPIIENVDDSPVITITYPNAAVDIMARSMM